MLNSSVEFLLFVLYPASYRVISITELERMTEKHLDCEELISTSEAADYSGLTHDFLREFARAAKLQARKVGRD
jgi:hypothetical protein